MVAVVVGRYVVKYTLSEDALQLSNHPHGNVTSHLARLWHHLAPTDIEAQSSLLRAQRDIYTYIESHPDHRAWRSFSAQTLSTHLITTLSGLLDPHLPSPHAIHRRSNVLQDLFVKGYRINFRSRMESVVGLEVSEP